MEIFLTLLLKLTPLYLIILLGYIAGKYLRINKESLATLLIYIVAPIIVFNGVITTTISLSSLSLPFLFFLLCSCICFLFYWVGKFLWKDSTRNILAFTAGSGNTGYFGIPVAIALFNNNVLGLVVLSILGFILYENSVGFFITAKGHHTIKEAIIKVLKLPTMYAFFLGLIMNLMSIHLGSIYSDAVSNFKGAYIVLGMMIIGLGLSSITNLKLDIKFIGITFLAKFIVWPLLIIGIIFIDKLTLHLYNSSTEKIMILMSIVPLAANTVAYATELNAQPEKASLVVLLSTIFALFYVPLITILYLR